MTASVKKIALVACLSLAAISGSNATEIALTAAGGFGVYDDSGNQGTTLITGLDQQFVPPFSFMETITRHYALFDLGDNQLDGATITGAKLQYADIAWDAGDGPETLQIFDVDEACFSSCTGTDIFNMLGTGTLYNSGVVEQTDLVVEIDLSSIVNELNLAAASDDIFGFGGRIGNETPNIANNGDRLILLAALGTSTAFSQLILTVADAQPTVPAPAPFLLLGLGMVLLRYLGRIQSRHPVADH